MVIALLAATGLVWSVDWWESGVYRLFGQTTRPTYGAHPAAPAQPALGTATPTSDPTDRALHHLLYQHPTTWTSLDLSWPAPDSKNSHELEGYLDYAGGSAWHESDTCFHHTATGALTYAERFGQKSTGEKWRNSNYPIHVGTIGGWPTRVLVLLGTLVCASLPVTGFLIWWGRCPKSKAPRGLAPRLAARPRPAARAERQPA